MCDELCESEKSELRTKLQAEMDLTHALLGAIFTLKQTIEDLNVQMDPQRLVVDRMVCPTERPAL